MTARVEHHELEALLAPGTRPAIALGVSQRDFAHPMRLSSEQRAALLLGTRKALDELTVFVRATLGGDCAIELADLREISAERLAAELPEPLTAMRFDVGGQPGWIAWQRAAAVAAVETLVGAAEVTPSARDVTRVERAMLHRILAGVARGLASAFGQNPGNASVVTDPEDLGDWKSGPSGADHHRVGFHLAFRGPGGPSTFHVYLPGLAPPAAPKSAAASAQVQLPAHLGPVDVELVIELGTCEVPLAELLELSPGDVIPLPGSRARPLVARVDGKPCGTAALGRRGRKLAVRMVDTEGAAEQARQRENDR